MKWFWRTPIITSSVLMHKDTFVLAEGFDENESFRFIEDWEFWLRLVHQEKIRVLNNPLIRYREYYKLGRNLRDVRKRVHKIFDKHRRLGLLSDTMERKARGNNYISIGRTCLDFGDAKSIVFYIKGLFLSYGAKNMLCVITGLLLCVTPRFIRSTVIKKTYRIKNRLAHRSVKL